MYHLDCARREKLRTFHHEHRTPLDRLLADLQAAVPQLPGHTCRREAEIVAEVLERQTHRHRGGVAIGERLPAVLARLRIRATSDHEHRGSVLNSREDPTPPAVNVAAPAFSVPGALLDHHRLMRRFGADPLMHYLFGDP